MNAQRSPVDPFQPEGKQQLEVIKEGSMVVIDEAAYRWPAINTANPPDHIAYLTQHRKHGLDFWIITQDPSFLHPYILKNADRHIHLVQEWSGRKMFEWSEYCNTPKLKTSRERAVKKSYKLEKKAFDLYYSASIHAEKPKRAVPKMVYAAVFLLFATPAMIIFSFTRVTENINPTAKHATQQDIEPPSSGIHLVDAPATASVIHNVFDTIESTQLLTDKVDWGTVSACISTIDKCACYGRSAERLSIDNDTCRKAVTYGWASNRTL